MLYLLLVLVLLLRCILEGGSISVMFPGLSMCTVRLGRRGSVSIWGCVLWKPTRCAGYSVGMRARLVRWVVSGTNILHEKWGRSTWELNSCHFFLHKVKPLSFIEGCVTWMQWVLCVHFLPWQRHALNTSPFFDSLRRFSCGVNMCTVGVTARYQLWPSFISLLPPPRKVTGVTQLLGVQCVTCLACGALWKGIAGLCPGALISVYSVAFLQRTDLVIVIVWPDFFCILRASYDHRCF